MLVRTRVGTPVSPRSYVNHLGDVGIPGKTARIAVS